MFETKNPLRPRPIAFRSDELRTMCLDCGYVLGSSQYVRLIQDIDNDNLTCYYCSTSIESPMRVFLKLLKNNNIESSLSVHYYEKYNRLNVEASYNMQDIHDFVDVYGSNMLIIVAKEHTARRFKIQDSDAVKYCIVSDFCLDIKCHIYNTTTEEFWERLESTS